jgi:phosphate uptake regulator
MEMRKVQITGGSTFIVSLPKWWANEVGLHPNDTVAIMPQTDGTLVLTPRLSESDEPRRKKFHLDEEPGLTELLRDLIGAYVTGFDIIEVHQEPRLSTDVRNVVRKFTQLVIGPEIIEEDIDDIKTRDLSSAEDLPFATSLKRMFRIVSSMHREAAQACAELDLGLANDVIMRDTEVDRLDWLVARQYNLLIRNIQLAERLGTAREHAANFLLMARALERIGDHSTRMAMQVDDLKTSKARKRDLKYLRTLSDSILPVLADTMTALFQRDGELAHQAMERANYTLDLIRDYSSDLAGSPVPARLPLNTVLDSLDRTVHYIKDMGELVINYTIDVEDDG